MDNERSAAAMPQDIPNLDEDMALSRPLDSLSDDSLPHQETSKCSADHPAIVQRAGTPLGATAVAKLPPEVIKLYVA